MASVSSIAAAAVPEMLGKSIKNFIILSIQKKTGSYGGHVIEPGCENLLAKPSLISVFVQFSRRTLHTRQVCVGSANQTCAVVRIGLIEVRKHRVLVRVVGYMVKLARQVGNQLVLIRL